MYPHENTLGETKQYFNKPTPGNEKIDFIGTLLILFVTP